MFPASLRPVFQRPATWIVLLTGCLLPALALGHRTPAPALQAHQMLEGVWSQAIELRNSDPHSDYPEIVYATVFEFEGTLWLYTNLGTQPVPGTRHQVARHRDNLLPLLQNTIEPGFETMRVLPPQSSLEAPYPELERGCVIEALYALAQLHRQGVGVRDAKLLFYSVPRGSPRGIRGHAILVFETAAGHFYINPPELDVIQPLAATLKEGAVEVASLVEAGSGTVEILEAFFLPLQETESPPTTSELYAGDS